MATPKKPASSKSDAAKKVAAAVAPEPAKAPDDLEAITVITETIVYKGKNAVHHFSTKGDPSKVKLDDVSIQQFDTGIFEILNDKNVCVGLLWVAKVSDPGDPVSHAEKWALGSLYKWPTAGAGDRTYTFHPTADDPDKMDDVTFKNKSFARLGANVTFVRADCKSF